MHRNFCNNIASIIQGTPDASAEVCGSRECPDIRGTVRFYQTDQGVLVYADICGLPTSGNGSCEQVFGFHIHEGDQCTGSTGDPFADTGSHFDTKRRRHPRHSGDLPPLFGNDGHALMAVLTDRFCVNGVIGRTVIIHDSPDDFTTQPSGNAGSKIACGVICRNN